MLVSYDWVLKCIESSTNEFHISACRVLIELYRMQYSAPDLQDKLTDALMSKGVELMIEV